MVSLLYSLLNENKTVAAKSIQALSLCADKCTYYLYIKKTLLYENRILKKKKKKTFYINTT